MLFYYLLFPKSTIMLFFLQVRMYGNFSINLVFISFFLHTNEHKRIPFHTHRHNCFFYIVMGSNCNFIGLTLTFYEFLRQFIFYVRKWNRWWKCGANCSLKDLLAFLGVNVKFGCSDLLFLIHLFISISISVSCEVWIVKSITIII